MALFVCLSAARLPFKRLNPEPKENQPPKRPCAHACPEPGVQDSEIENESSALPVHSGPPLINGRGPLDGFLSRSHPAPSNENVVIDLTSDSSFSPVKRLVSPAPASPASPCLPTKDKHQDKGDTASSAESSNADHTPNTQTIECTVAKKEEKVEEVVNKDGNQKSSISQLNLTQDSDSEPEEQNESGNVSSLGNKSLLSNSSVSSSESSPEKPDDPTPNTTPTVCYISSSFYSIQTIAFQRVLFDFIYIYMCVNHTTKRHFKYYKLHHVS